MTSFCLRNILINVQNNDFLNSYNIDIGMNKKIYYIGFGVRVLIDKSVCLDASRIPAEYEIFSIIIIFNLFFLNNKI